MKSKIIKLILVFAITLTIFSNYSIQAIENPLDNPDAYTIDPGGSETELMEMGGKVLGIINTVGVVVSVIVLMVIGIKYMMGSVEEKAEYKKTMAGYIIGAVILFSASTIPNLIYNISINLYTEVEEEYTPPKKNPTLPIKPPFEKY